MLLRHDDELTSIRLALVSLAERIIRLEEALNQINWQGPTDS